MLDQNPSTKKMIPLLHKPVVVGLMGGLGNQLFQYAAARTVADRIGTDLFFDISSYDTDVARVYELGAFHIRGSVLPHRKIAKGILQNVQRYFLLKNISTVQEKSFRFDSGLANMVSGGLLKGYFQSEKYFVAHKAQIRKDLTLKGPLTELTQGLAQQIKNTKTPVCLHIRRGDYVSNPHATAFHGLLPLEYYNSAVEIIKKSNPELHLFLFSDDPDWVAQNLNFGVSQTVMKANPPERGVEDLYLMSLCRHHIIANSSFSWWGAWLADSPKQIVIAPQRWFVKQDMDDTDLIPESWIRV